MSQRVRIPHRGYTSFVCHSTPHFDSTSREVSYSVAVMIHHTQTFVNRYFTICEKIGNIAKKQAKILLTRRKNCGKIPQ